MVGLDVNVGVFVRVGLGVKVDVFVEVGLDVKVGVGVKVAVIVGVFVDRLAHSCAIKNIWEVWLDANEKDGVPNQIAIPTTIATKTIIHGYNLVFLGCDGALCVLITLDGWWIS